MTVSASEDAPSQLWYRFWCRKPGKAPFTIQAARLWEGRSVRASSLLRQLAKGGCCKAIAG
ncbi:MAG: hypothetical protein ACLR9W_04730 [Enterobacter hormaechei]